MSKPEATEVETTPTTRSEAVEYVEDVLDLQMSGLESFPRYIFIETINTCNARCIMCAIDFDDGRRTNVISDNLFEKIIRELGERKDHVQKVMLYLDCEPLMDRKLADKIRKVKEAGLIANTATNGSILTEKRSIEILEAGLDEIYITIESLDKTTYEAIRRRLKFDDVVENTLRFVKLRDKINPKCKVRVQAILQEMNLHEGEAIKAFWGDVLHDSDQIALQRVHNWAGAVDVIEFGDEHNINDIPCISLWGTLAIHSDGEVGLCTMDVKREEIIGDLRTQSIAEVWNSDTMQRIREIHLTRKRHEHHLCDGCTHWREQKRELRELNVREASATSS